MHSHRIADFPIQVAALELQADLKRGGLYTSSYTEIHMDGLFCYKMTKKKKKKELLRVSVDDILGASFQPKKNDRKAYLHCMFPGKGKDENRLKRKYHRIRFRFKDEKEANGWIQAIQALVKWFARVPLSATRKLKVVVNPHSGKRKGLKIWAKWQPFFEMAGIICDVTETKYSGHARDIGKTLDLSQKYEAIVFIGGDGTVNEFMNGVFTRDEEEWRHLVATTPVSLICAGTDNAFGIGVGTPTHQAAVYCVIKRKVRPLDVIVIEGDLADGTKKKEYACCGVSYGIGGDIAEESEKTRWLGVYRYAWLKVKRGVLAPRKHECKIKYILSDNVEKDPKTNAQVLRTYFEIADIGAQDQHHIEMCSVYDDTYTEKRWQGDSSAIYHPCSEIKYPKEQWKSEEGVYNSVGVSNVYFELAYSHPSDGNMDLIIARKPQRLSQTVDVVVKYVGGKMLQCDLVDYFKVKALIIDQKVDRPINVDGEIFTGPGPFRMEIVPHLLGVLSEK
jgi:diacylglycerol kinase family enzyme